MPGAFEQISLHPFPAIVAAAAVIVLALFFALRSESRAWLGPSAIAMGLFALGFACFSSVRQIINVFRAMAATGMGGLGSTAAGLLETRYPVLCGETALLVAAGIGLAALSLGTNRPAAADAPPTAPPSPALTATLFVFSSVAVVLAAALTLWDGTLASWLLRIIGSDDQTASLATISRNVGLSLSGLALLCFVTIVGALALAIFSLAIASSAAPPRWFIQGNWTLLSLVALLSVLSLFAGYRQRACMYQIALTGSLPGTAKKPPGIAGPSTRSTPRVIAPGKVIPAPPEAGAARVQRISADIAEPVEISRIKPEYPEDARRARIQGVVILEAVISEDGTVRSVKILRSVDPRVDQAAERAVSQWKYRPATRKSTGEPVAVYLTVTVTFRLE